MIYFLCIAAGLIFIVSLYSTLAVEITFLSIRNAMRLILMLTAGIASVSREQRQNIEQVNNSIIEMDGVTQENSLLVEKNTSVTGEIFQNADRLIEILKEVKEGATAD